MAHHRTGGAVSDRRQRWLARHRDEYNAHRRAVRAERKRRGVCVWCEDSPLATTVYCESCRAHHAQLQAKRRSQEKGKEKDGRLDTAQEACYPQPQSDTAQVPIDGPLQGLVIR